MKKNYILFYLLFVAGIFFSCTKEPNSELGNDDLPVSETEITQKMAEEHLLNLLDEMEAEATKNGKIVKKRKISSRYTTGSTESITRTNPNEQEAYVHIFNFEDNGGTAIMSGDSRVEPLLALTDQGELSPDKVVTNPGMGLFLENAEVHYFRRIEEHDNKLAIGVSAENPSGTVTYRYGPWSTATWEMQNGPCRVEWGQEGPYNIDYIPGQYAGCVPVAVAQLMSCYEYPSSYYEYSFNWTEMNKSPIPIITYSDERRQISRLMQLLGTKRNLDADYKSDVTSVSPKDVPKTLENFGYSSGGRLKDYNSSEIMAELRSGYYCLVRGFSMRQRVKFLGITIYWKYSGGHTWLAHGLLERYRIKSKYVDGIKKSESWDSHLYIKYNWGHDGGSDGWFLSGVFDQASVEVFSPSASETKEGTAGNYQYKNEMTIGIRK